MWKKIVYYACMIVIGIVFMIMFWVTQITNRYTSLVNKSLKSGDYTNVLGLYTTYGNKNAIYQNTLADGSKISVYETATVSKTPFGDKTKELIDVEYSVFIEGNKRVTKNQVSPEGVIFNKTGFKVTNADNESYEYYDNHYLNGVVNKDSEDIYNGYDLDLNTSTLNLYQYSIKHDFIKEYASFTTLNIKKIDILDAVGNTYASISFDQALAYSSATHTKLLELKSVYNEAAKNGSETALKAMFDNWKTEYMSIDGAVTALKSNAIFNAAFYVKVVAAAIGFILFVLVVGDFLVGKRRILRLFQGLGKQGNEGSFVSGKKNTNDVKDVTDKIEINVKDVKGDK